MFSITSKSTCTFARRGNAASKQGMATGNHFIINRIEIKTNNYVYILSVA